MKEKITMVVPLAIMIEAIITYINQFFVSGEFCWEMLLSIIFGIVIYKTIESFKETDKQVERLKGLAEDIENGVDNLIKKLKKRLVLKVKNFKKKDRT